MNDTNETLFTNNDCLLNSSLFCLVGGPVSSFTSDHFCRLGGKIKTPNLNAMASRGMRCTDFQVSAAVCSASRAALLTGCYHPRVGINGALMPNSTRGINSDETTIAEMLKSKGYSTACFGKWHLGHQEQFMPTQHGFDEYFGLPYSNDMWTRNPVQWKGKHANGHVGWTTLPLIEGTKVLIEDVTPEDQAQIKLN